jgi:hypothetical protein
MATVKLTRVRKLGFSSQSYALGSLILFYARHHPAALGGKSGAGMVNDSCPGFRVDADHGLP